MFDKRKHHPKVLKNDHPAIREARTLFPNRRTRHSLRVLKAGGNSRKIGSHVVKGPWYGMPIFTLTLEERATCPSYCKHWNDCYGNHMQWAHRQRHGEFLEAQLDRELRTLQYYYPDGFVVRLHILGDFYSSQYIKRWHNWMLDLPAMRIFGFTAHRPDTRLGKMLMMVREYHPKRWWIRFSDSDKATWLSTGESGITCPMQTGKTDCCGTCGLCWLALKPIKFLLH